MILRSLAEFGVVIAAGIAFVVFGRRIIAGQHELTARGQDASNSTPESWQAFHDRVGAILKTFGGAMIITSLIAVAIWTVLRSDLVVAANWLLGAGWIIVLSIAAAKAANKIESADPRYPNGRG